MVSGAGGVARTGEPSHTEEETPSDSGRHKKDPEGPGHVHPHLGLIQRHVVGGRRHLYSKQTRGCRGQIFIFLLYFSYVLFNFILFYFLFIFGSW